MARHRSRSRSYTARRRSRSPSPRGRKRYEEDDYRRRDRRERPAASGLLVRNLPLNSRADDIRIPFERYGPVKDVYLPRDFYSGKLRGFGFVKYCYADHASEAKEKLNFSIIGGRKISIVYAEDNRKTPHEMRLFSRSSGRYEGSYRRCPSRSPRRRHYSSSRSRSPVRTSKNKNESPEKKLKSRALSRESSPNDSMSPVGQIHMPSGSHSQSYSPLSD